ncbi:type III-B CRISPR module RAMP protein Cmr6 [Desulfococcus multivorans]|uniref:CRISPR-associated RAMP protein, Cmr6 family n=1 Tax=Desulfococcus multivorans DSM 2059 TaxID=1121405 RepID=S7T9L2_DESML|nr:type III-B CRISPR module RAMP protein Cmr6 [Desulfococcus multivorans]AOY59353.1 Cas6: CRISPR-associated endonuclease Cas6 [Desulfococcus multivorans]AQV01568.1 type III-B CRISPR module RAMP protein Cmr6 [Desulfococcus multivorans]EPR33306.1 CRISPR-associated RAMP protein, Cmr6 family [Desulfococcus multivorans DSM 2059]SKA14002.1 CRISPR-associated protein Cmr6 [Desulfococcus multivorans DSM 2059]
MVYPFSTNLQAAMNHYPAGNFGLWFNKLIPVNDDAGFKACDNTGGTTNVANFYKRNYDAVTRSDVLRDALSKRHQAQAAFCRRYGSAGFQTIAYRATLRAPFVTGIGRSHPGETGMTFDHTLGIPFLPASGIKGVVRLGHILNLIDDPKAAASLIHGDELDDTDPVSMVPQLFGGDKRKTDDVEKCRGEVIFLDAYPEKVPSLEVDIMNPHYRDYYDDDEGRTPPGDYLDPVPIQFLTVPRGEVFIFRAVLPRDEILSSALAAAFISALTELGFGAKTAVGYGRFKVDEASLTKDTSDPGKAGADTAGPKGEAWENANLTFTPGNQEVTAKADGKTAVYKGKEIIPDAIAKKFFKTRKASVKQVMVEPIGNRYRIVAIIP